MRQSRLLTLALFSLTALAFSFPPRALGATGLSLTPPVTEILLSPNRSLTHSLRLTNTGDDVHYTLSLHRLIPTDSYGHSTIDPNPLDESSIPLVLTLTDQSWQTPLPLAAGATTAINLKLEGANVETPTDVYLALLIRPVPAADLTTSSLATPALSALLLITLTPDSTLPVNLTLEDPALSPIHDSLTPLRLSLTAKNPTATMLRFKGSLTLLSPRGRVLKELTLDPTLILGETSRALPVFTTSPNLLAFGPHQLKVSLITEGGRELSSHSYVIWFLPLRLAFFLGIALLVLTILKIRAIRLTKPAVKA